MCQASFRRLLGNGEEGVGVGLRVKTPSRDAKEMKRLPTLIVDSTEGEFLTARAPSGEWIGERWSIFVLAPDRFRGCWVEIDSVDRKCWLVSLRLEDPPQTNFVEVGSTYEYLDGYWGDRAELVLDRSREWKLKTFVPKDSVRYARDGTKTHVPGGWDHEHCYVCQKTISHIGEVDREGYVDQEDVWVCCHCYEQYVTPRSLAFVFR